MPYIRVYRWNRVGLGTAPLSYAVEVISNNLLTGVPYTNLDLGSGTPGKGSGPEKRGILHSNTTLY